MILVTLGTQDKPFNRLLDAVQKEIDKGNIKDRVVVQAGCTKYESKDMEVFDLIPMDEFDRLLDECDLLITHGGVGTIIGGLKRGKKVIAVPRRAKYGEHVRYAGVGVGLTAVIIWLARFALLRAKLLVFTCSLNCSILSCSN